MYRILQVMSHEVPPPPCICSKGLGSGGTLSECAFVSRDSCGIATEVGTGVIGENVIEGSSRRVTERIMRMTGKVTGRMTGVLEQQNVNFVM